MTYTKTQRLRTLQINKTITQLPEQGSDPTLLIFKREMLGLPFDEQDLTNDARYMQYSRNNKRSDIKEDFFLQTILY